MGAGKDGIGLEKLDLRALLGGREMWGSENTSRESGSSSITGEWDEGVRCGR